jgi:hypothetical protein
MAALCVQSGGKGGKASGHTIRDAHRVSTERHPERAQASTLGPNARSQYDEADSAARYSLIYSGLRGFLPLSLRHQWEPLW